MSGDAAASGCCLVHQTQQFTAWLDVLSEAGARLSGVYSVPLLAPALAARLGVRGGRALVVTANSTGLRQCYVEDGRLRFARLERTADMSPDALAAFVRVETLRLAQYLTTLRALPREGPPVQVLVVAPAAQRAAFEQALVSDARLAFHTVVIDEAARKVGIKQLPPGAAGEQLFLHLALRHPPKEQFARGEDRRSFPVAPAAQSWPRARPDRRLRGLRRRPGIDLWEPRTRFPRSGARRRRRRSSTSVSPRRSR